MSNVCGTRCWREFMQANINPAAAVGRLRPRRIAFATMGNPADVKFWSGTPFHMAQALAREGHEIVHVGPLHSSLLPLSKGYAKLCRLLKMRKRAPFHMLPVAAQLAADAARKIH